MISTHDWSLHRKGPRDQARHQERVRRALRDHLSDLLAEESILAVDGKRTTRIVLHSLEEFSFRFQEGEEPSVGQGPIGPEGTVIEAGGAEVLGGAGDGPGTDLLEAEVGWEEVLEALKERITLPRLEPRGTDGIQGPHWERTDIRRQGALKNLDRRRSLYQAAKRRATEGGGPTLVKDDLRFRTYEDRLRPESKAAIIAVRDVSGSMGAMKKQLSRSFFFWTVRLLKEVYPQLEFAFVCHHTQAKEVDQETFFRLAESGGTKVSSGYDLARRILEDRFPVREWNRFVIHFTDGDNWGESDNRLARGLLDEMLPQVNLFGYAEVRETDRPSPLMDAWGDITSETFVRLTMRRREDILSALTTLFGKGG